jgi:hypothetical protein
MPKELRDLILDAVNAAKKPVTFKGLAALVKSKEEPLRTALEQLVGAGELFRWPNLGKSQYFWRIAAEERAREQVLAAASKRAMSKADLIKAAGYPVKHFPALVPVLIAERQLQAVPAFGSGAKLLVRAGEQSAYFQAARDFVSKKIRSAGFDPAAFFTEEQNEPVADRLVLEAIGLLEPVPGIPVSTLRLRNQLRNLSKLEFDRAALDLRRQQKVFLSQHADPFNLAEEDRNLLIDGQDGTYYVAVSIR